MTAETGKKGGKTVGAEDGGEVGKKAGEIKVILISRRKSWFDQLNLNGPGTRPHHRRVPKRRSAEAISIITILPSGRSNFLLILSRGSHVSTVMGLRTNPLR